MANGNVGTTVIMTAGAQPSPAARQNLKRIFSSENPPGMGPATKKPTLQQAPPVSGVGVMDVGQGSCILAYDQTGNPLFYYDIGYPLVFFRASAPDTLRQGPAYLGPCLFQTPRVYLSHWDYDHYRLAYISHVVETARNGVDIVTFDWIFPVQNIGPVASNFRALFTNAHPMPAATPMQQWLDQNGNLICTVLRCVGADINNSGIALVIPTRLPSDDAPDRLMVFTGDASFHNVPLTAAMLANLPGITAVHHGAISDGAAADLPRPPAPFNAVGRIAYSYGVNAGTNVHPYGHPRDEATAAYSQRGWNRIACTAEGTFYANDGLRGNIRIAKFLDPRCLPNSCAFRIFPDAKKLD